MDSFLNYQIIDEIVNYFLGLYFCGLPRCYFYFQGTNVLNVEFGSGRVYSIAVATVLLSIINSVKSVGSLNLFSNTVTGYPDMTPTDETFLRGSQNISHFEETLFWGENHDYWLGRLKRLFFMLCLYSGDDIWGRETYSFSTALIVGLLISLIY